MSEPTPRLDRRAFLRLAGVTSLVIVSARLPAGAAPANAHRLDLAGQWRFALDPQDANTSKPPAAPTDRITLPGVLQSQGYGDPISTATPWVLSLYDHHWYQRADYIAYTLPGRVKVPFLCQPPRHYLGAAWYVRDVQIPPTWQGRRAALTLERVHWSSTVFVDGRMVGDDTSNNSLCAPHEHDLGVLAPGTHQLAVRVDNRMLLPYRPDAHGVSDSLADTWNGIAGDIALLSTTPVWIDDAQVFPNVAKKSALIRVQIGNVTGESGAGTLSAGGVTAPVTWDASGGKAELEVPLGPNAQTWDEFNPVLHRLTVRLTGGGADDARDLTFGLREITTQGKDFVLNGRVIGIRGTHNGGDFPLTGYPATDVASWKRIISTCKSYGLNHMRFHSWCPPDAAFTAADELGFYLQVESGMWNPFTPGGPIEKMLYAETERITRAYGNHPSFVMLSASNEPAGAWQRVLPAWVTACKAKDSRRLFTEKSGWDFPDPDTSQYLVQPHVNGAQLRGDTGWFGKDFRQATESVTVPVLSHELGQWCAYPDYTVIGKFTGYMRPGNYEIFRDSLAAHGLTHKNGDFAQASGRYQLACYKEEIEANLRTPGLAGFQLLDLHDYVGQGTALVGLLDTFWESKGYATPAEFRRFCGPTVPLARLASRVYTKSDPFAVDVEVAHYGPAPLENIASVWKITDTAGKVRAHGKWPAQHIPLGKNTPLGKVAADLSRLPAPATYTLVVSLPGTSATNSWDFWLYPASVSASVPPAVTVTQSWDEAEAKLATGGKVLYQPRLADLSWGSPPLDSVPIFWDAQMGPTWRRMLGLWNDVRHPALAGFPTDSHFDWQWTELVRGTRAINIDTLPPALQPIVQPIDDWNRNYKLGLVFECRVGPGKLMVCAADITSSLDTRPVARQLRRSLLDYMGGAEFQPTVAVTAAQMRGLLFDTLVMRKLGATVQAGDQAANMLVDGDPNTFWQSAPGTQHPHTINVTFPSPVAMTGLLCMNRQNEREHAGDIREYTVQVSDDGSRWQDVTRGELASTFAPQRVRFPQPVMASHLRLTALSGFGAWDRRNNVSVPDTTAALAELAVLYAGPKLPDNAGGDTVQYQRARSATPEIDAGPTAAPPPRPPTQ